LQQGIETQEGQFMRNGNERGAMIAIVYLHHLLSLLLMMADIRAVPNNTIPPPNPHT